MNTKIYRTINDQIIKDWHELWKKSPNANYANAPQWFLSAIEAFGYNDYVIIAIYEENNLAAIGALIKDKKYGIEFYTIANGNYVCCSPFLFIKEEKKIIEAFVKIISQLGNIFIENMPEEFLILLKKSNLKMDAITQTVNYYLMPQKDKKGLPIIPNRKKLMHKARSMQDHFTLKPIYGATENDLETVFDIDNKSRKKKKGYSTFADPKAKDLFRSLSKHFKKNFCIHILYFDKKPIAYEIGFIVGKTYFGNQIAITQEYLQYSPGKVMIVHLLENLIALGVNNFNLGSGDSYVKRAITKTNQHLYQVIISKNLLTKNYISCICKSRNYLFNQIHHHTKTYSIYRKIRKTLSS